MPSQSSIIVVDTTYQEKTREYRDHLLTMGHRPHGAMTKTRFLREFLHFCEVAGVRDTSDIAAPHIQQYYDYITIRPSMRDGGKLAPHTCCHHMRGIELFFTMLQDKGEIHANPTSTLKFTSPPSTGRERTVLTQEEIKQLYHHCQSPLERAILSLAYGCGLRVSELVNCNIEDIRLRDNIIIVPSGKFNKRRVIPLSDGVKKDLSDYFHQIRIHVETVETRAFILHSKGGRMKKDTYSKCLKRIIKRTEDKTITGKQISIHNLRHSIATHLLEQKMSLEQVRMFLGHNQLETTEIYTHVSGQQLKQMINHDNH